MRACSPASLLALALAASASVLSAAPESHGTWKTPPGWTETRGGEGGKTLRVTTLAATGPGSLAEAIAAEGPRVIEFAIAGTIDLGGRPLKISRPHLTLAGETAPSPGITLVQGSIGIATHDVIVRHLRIRTIDLTRGKDARAGADGISTGGGARDVIVDHCSITWGTDENLSASGPRFNGAAPDDWRRNTSHRVTFSHCLVAEGLNPGNSKGTLIHDNATDIVLLGNLYVSHDDRHPLFKGGVRAVAVNNVIHNPGRRIMQFGHVPSQWSGHALQPAALAMVGNVARQGPSSAAAMAFFEIWPDYGPCEFYLHDNLFVDRAGRPLSADPMFRDRNRPGPTPRAGTPVGSGFQYQLVLYSDAGGMRRVSAPPLWPPRLTARPAAETEAWVLDNAGARPWDRDAVDHRLVDEAKTGRVKVIHP